MRTQAVVLREMGLPRPYGDSRPLTVEELRLDAPGPGEALVRVRAAGLCHSDLSVIDGSRPRPMPMVLGHEATGVVEALGSDALDVRVGDAVVFSFVPVCGRCTPCQSGRPALCEAGARANTAGELLSGARRFRALDGSVYYHHLGVSAFSELTVVSTASLVRIPADLPPEKAALFGCALVTGVGAVTNTAQVPAGSSVVVFGLGGVGLSAVMGARLVGAYPVIAVDPVADKRELAARVGADVTLPADDDAIERCRELTAGGADYVFEAVGSAAVLATAYAVTRRGGTTVSVGLPHPRQTLSVPAASLVAEERRVIGSYMGSAVPRRDVPRLIALYQARRLPVDQLHSATIALPDVNEAFEALAAGRAVRQVLRLADG